MNALEGGHLVGRYRIPSLVFLVLVMTVAVYVRRWPPRGFAWGMVAFNGAFLGFFLHDQLGLGDLGWLAADLAIGVLASLVVRFALFRPDPGNTLARMRRSWEARVRRLLALAAAVLREEDEQAVRRLRDRLRRQLVRLNESTLMIDAQLAQTRPSTAAVRREAASARRSKASRSAGSAVWAASVSNRPLGVRLKSAAPT